MIQVMGDEFPYEKMCCFFFNQRNLTTAFQSASWTQCHQWCSLYWFLIVVSSILKRCSFWILLQTYAIEYGWEYRARCFILVVHFGGPSILRNFISAHSGSSKHHRYCCFVFSRKKTMKTGASLEKKHWPHYVVSSGHSSPRKMESFSANMANMEIPLTGWWELVAINLAFSQKYWECHHPNWRSHIFQRGGPTTNQTCRWVSQLWTFIKKEISNWFFPFALLQGQPSPQVTKHMKYTPWMCIIFQQCKGYYIPRTSDIYIYIYTNIYIYMYIPLSLYKSLKLRHPLYNDGWHLFHTQAQAAMEQRVRQRVREP